MALLPLFMAYSTCVEEDEKTEPCSLREATALDAEDVMEVLPLSFLKESCNT